MKWDADRLRAELRSEAEQANRHLADLKSRISKGEPTASKDLHDETLGKLYFARLLSSYDLINSPERLVQFLSDHNSSKIQFLGAHDTKVARSAYRRGLKALLIKAEVALR